VVAADRSVQDSTFGSAAHAALEARAKYACEWAFNANKKAKAKMRQAIS